ncbi:MAG: serine hydroxymethyltransferase [Oscillospiraceae bacterium]|nr:serine hydroxymethyltransferase [Oscillospiraceae bacterium]
MKATRKNDPALYEIVREEYTRQRYNIEMIASESTSPIECLELAGCVFNNKTTEGYPGKRFQAGSQVADKMELLACERGQALYGADHINIQPYSGSTANYGVYAAMLRLGTMAAGDTILSMSLDDGGHLTHGSPANFMSKFFHFEHYALNHQTEQIDYDGLEAKAKEVQPKLIIAGGSAYPQLIDYERIGNIAKETGAKYMVDMAHISGLVAAKVIPSPVPYADFVTSSMAKTLCGPRGGFVLCKQEYAKKLDAGVFPGSVSSIHLQTMAAKAYTFKYAATPEFHEIMSRVVTNAKYLAKSLTEKGFRVVSGGTENHIVLLDLRPKGISGKTFQDALEYVGITLNKNMIPGDTASPNVTSGVRIGLTSTAQRGFHEADIEIVAQIMNEVAEHPDDQATLDRCKASARDLISKFPLYDAQYADYFE